jgi:hypothetical protein
MNYINNNSVRFKIHSTFRTGIYKVKYYSAKTYRSRTYKSFFIPDEETRHEMFYILSKLRLCKVCQDCFSQDVCSTCLFKETSQNIQDEKIEECPVCYEKMFRVDGTMRVLECRHKLCIRCSARLTLPTLYIKCPLCRQESA